MAPTTKRLSPLIIDLCSEEDHQQEEHQHPSTVSTASRSSRSFETIILLEEEESVVTAMEPRKRTKRNSSFKTDPNERNNSTVGKDANIEDDIQVVVGTREMMPDVLEVFPDADPQHVKRLLVECSGNVSLVLDQLAELNSHHKGEISISPAISPNAVLATARIDRADQDFAKKLQAQEDEEYAKELQAQAAQKRLEESDQAVATSLQTELYREEKEKEDRLMQTTRMGKAWKLVERVLALRQRLLSDAEYQHYSSTIAEVARDDMYFMAEKMLTAQESFRHAGKPYKVDLGYHYTRSANMDRIRTDGLLTKAERDARNIQSNFNGSAFGDGVYTTNDPYAVCGSYGDVGLLVARLQGLTSSGRQARDVDTVLGGNGIVVLKTSSQCLPLLRFNASLIQPYKPPHPGNQIIYRFHCQLQKIIDEFLNDGETNPNAEWLDSNRFAAGMPFGGVPSIGGQAAFSSATGARNALLARSAALSQLSTSGVIKPPTAHPSDVVRYEAPDNLDNSLSQGFCFVITTSGNCPICLDALSSSGQPVSLIKCKHEFHLQCFSDSVLKNGNKCPVCRVTVGRPQGKMPSGTMRITHSPHTTCRGYGPGTIIIDYAIASGIQKTYHDFPGQRHGSTQRRAYLPDNNDGRSLLKRLKYAFRHGLTFTVGTSLTTGATNVVTWASIHHKTSLSGPHGYPDSAYMANCRQELDALGVPPAEQL